eukprot:197987-Alexandrium_andersonii.AAC.1
MSASLVGSEMCIRDRRSPRRAAPGARTRRGSRTRPRRPVGAPARAWMRTCLLYTSDAADDM